MLATPPTRPSHPEPDLQQPSFRSGTVARLSGMPVSTLRVWEQRYQAIKPTTAPSGHRMYSAADVERVALLRQLTEHGHAISAVAGLTIGQLRDLSHVRADDSLRRSAAQPAPTAPLRIVVVGQAMALRLRRPAVLNHSGKLPVVLGVFDSLAEAAKVAKAQIAATESDVEAPDLLLWQASDLQADALPELNAAQDAWRAREVAVSYRFSSAAERNKFARAGAHMAREPADDDALGVWLATLASVLGERASGGSEGSKNATPEPWSIGALGLSQSPAPLRRFDDAALTEFAGISSHIACECPGHVAELLLQISSFEAYSAGCESRTPADAELHAYVHRIAGAARILFESALERIAAAEGYALPPTRPK